MPDDPRFALATLLARLAAASRAARPAIVAEFLPLLADDRIPAQARIEAAAQVLRAVPDRSGPVRRVARALTAGLSGSRALDRLRQLQHRLGRSEALDAMIDSREGRVKLACPRCHVRLSRVEMIKHLWHEHGLTLTDGTAHGRDRSVEDLRAAHAATGDTAPLDRAVALAGLAGLRRWAVEDDTPAEELAPLLAAAADRGAGLCPTCLAEVQPAVSPLPHPLTLSRGRLSGDGYAVGIGGNAWFQMVRLTTPERATRLGRLTLAPRFGATIAASAVLLLVQLVGPARGHTLTRLLAAGLSYLAVRLLTPAPGGANERAVDAAWTRLGMVLVEKESAARFLTRLCLASLGRGDPEARVGVLGAVAARAAGKASASAEDRQLLAAARVLQIEDTARFGRDEAEGIAGLAAAGFTGGQSADSAEFVVGSYLARERDPGNLGRLRVLLLAAAFEAGLTPRVLLDVWAAAPNLRRVMADPGHRLGLAFGLWRTRSARAWESVGHAETVFDLAHRSPTTATRVLANFPDLLLYHRPAPAIEEAVGPVLVCARGVAVGGHLTADPDATLRLTDGGRVLVFGRHRIGLAGRIPAEFLGVLRGWLRFRAAGLLPLLDGARASGPADVTRRVLTPFCTRCPVCGTTAAVTCGAVGRAVPIEA